MARKASGKRSKTADGTVRVHGKASNGEGSLYRDVDGSWRATYRVPGETNRRRARGKTREEAIARRAAKLEELSASMPGTFDRDTTVAELARWWLDTVARHRVRPSSFGKYRDRVARINETLGSMAVRSVKAEHVARWQSELLNAGLASGTVGDVRVTLRQVLEQGVIHELIPANPVDRVNAPKVVRGAKRALNADQARRLVDAAAADRHGAAIALLFVQGWRISEVLGLAWEDVDLDAGIATVERAAVYVDDTGMMLGPPKTQGAAGKHHLAAGTVELLRARRKTQAVERLASASPWPSHTYHGHILAPVFTTTTGGLVNRQAIAKLIVRSAERAGIDPHGLSTHTGRRTAVTVLYAEAGLDLADIARYVGHADQAITAGYVRALGQRPKTTATAAAAILDPTTHRHASGAAEASGPAPHNS
jgi:integrase